MPCLELLIVVVSTSGSPNDLTTVGGAPFAEPKKSSNSRMYLNV